MRCLLISRRPALRIAGSDTGGCTLHVYRLRWHAPARIWGERHALRATHPPIPKHLPLRCWAKLLGLAAGHACCKHPPCCSRKHSALVEAQRRSQMSPPPPPPQVLSRLTGNASYESKARAAVETIFAMRSARGLLGNTLDCDSGAWVRTDAGVGAGVDSFYEYLLKVRACTRAWYTT